MRLFGGTDPFFLRAEGYPLGSTVGGGGSLFLYSTVIPVDGVPMEFFFEPCSIDMTSFKLPTNGRDFIAPVQISFFVNGFNFDTEQTISVSGGGSGWIGFNYSNGFYYPGDFVQGRPPVVVPEPATLAFMGTGLMAIAGTARRKASGHSTRRASTRIRGTPQP